VPAHAVVGETPADTRVITPTKSGKQGRDGYRNSRN
jgi:hypothetical protein